MFFFISARLFLFWQNGLKNLWQKSKELVRWTKNGFHFFLHHFSTLSSLSTSPSVVNDLDMLPRWLLIPPTCATNCFLSSILALFGLSRTPPLPALSFSNRCPTTPLVNYSCAHALARLLPPHVSVFPYTKIFFSSSISLSGITVAQLFCMSRAMCFAWRRWGGQERS